MWILILNSKKNKYFKSFIILLKSLYTKDKEKNKWYKCIIQHIIYLENDSKYARIRKI